MRLSRRAEAAGTATATARPEQPPPGRLSPDPDPGPGPGCHGVRGALPLLRGRPAAQQHPLQHPQEPGAGGGGEAAAAAGAGAEAGAGAGGEAGAGVRRLFVRLAAAGGPEEPAGGVQGGLGRAGEDAALRAERALLPGAAPGRAARLGPQLLGAPAGAGAGAGPGALRDGGERRAQHAAEDPHQPAAGRAHAAAGTGAGAAAPTLGRRHPGHRGLPCQMLEPGHQHQGVRVPQGHRALQPG